MPTPIPQATQPPPAGMKTYATSAERAKAANAAFMDVANTYSMTKDGRVARYFGGLTYVDEGQYDSAETRPRFFFHVVIPPRLWLGIMRSHFRYDHVI